jgi:hypothetical protein
MVEVALEPEARAAGREAPDQPSGRWVAAGVFAASAAIGVTSGWGFSVDDALISARVAHHLANGLGYRFNPSGAIVDCVTPLGWAEVLSVFATGSTWQTLTRASLLGAAAWLLAAARLGSLCAEHCSRWRLGLLALALATCLPLGAWASSGMETPLVMALGVLALAPGTASALCAGAAAAWRPELAPWAMTLALGRAISRRATLREQALALVLSLGPPLLVAVLRQQIFGHPAPLAVFAKPSDLEHGLHYTLGAVLLSGPPYLLAAWRGWRGLPRELWAVVAALAVHAFVLLGVGGDWMPFWRLALPVLPGSFLVGAALLGSAGAGAALRFIPVFACALLLHVAQGSATRAVRADRARLMKELTPLLGGAARVATLDVGWVGAVADSEIVDLAGVTDPEVAYLPGGHTSKRLPPDFLERRRVDVLVLLADEPSSDASPRFARQVEQRVSSLRGADRFTPVGRITLNPRQSYRVLRRSDTQALQPGDERDSPQSDEGPP